MIINHNITALYANRQFNLNSLEMNKSLEKLSSGQRINKGLDDPAGLAVSEKMRAQIRGLNVASRNAQDGISFLQTAEGWLNETTSIVHRIRELAVQSANGIYSKEDREQITTEIKQLVSEIESISDRAEYNGMRILKGGFRNPNASKEGGSTEKSGTDNKSATRNVPMPDQQGVVHHELVDQKGGGGVTIQIGANMDQRERIFIENVSAASLGLGKGESGKVEPTIDLTSPEGANAAIGKADSALKYVNRQRANLGAYQMRMEMTSKGIDIAAENLQAAESRIRDTDMALEMVQYVKSKILTDTSGSLLAQANVKPYIMVKLMDQLSMR